MYQNKKILIRSLFLFPCVEFHENLIKLAHEDNIKKTINLIIVLYKRNHNT